MPRGLFLWVLLIEPVHACVLAIVDQALTVHGKFLQELLGLPGWYLSLSSLEASPDHHGIVSKPSYPPAHTAAPASPLKFRYTPIHPFKGPEPPSLPSLLTSPLKIIHSGSYSGSPIPLPYPGSIQALMREASCLVFWFAASL